ncbi:hypothetical protein VPH35_036402 [Triticum aestivum]|uniref:DUF4220 domain-containing protein n=1 Tax=Aegilops tauschii subsp. strangulata TaxID=200361 RepID=A0A453BB66_AEGTS
MSLKVAILMIHLLTLLVRELGGLCDSLEKGMIVTFSLSITGLLDSRWASTGHFPLTNLYESLIFLPWALYILHTISKIQNSKNDLSTITTPSTILMRGFATLGLLN